MRPRYIKDVYTNIVYEKFIKKDSAIFNSVQSLVRRFSIVKAPDEIRKYISIHISKSGPWGDIVRFHLDQVNWKNLTKEVDRYIEDHNK